jgi:hypothetical protein
LARKTIQLPSFRKLTSCHPAFPHTGQFTCRFGVPAAFHRTPPISQTERSCPHDGHFTTHARDSASMLCAHLAGNTAAKNFWIVLMVVRQHALKPLEINTRTSDVRLGLRNMLLPHPKGPKLLLRPKKIHRFPLLV